MMKMRIAHPKQTNKFLELVLYHLVCLLQQPCKALVWIMAHQKEKEVGLKDQRTKIRVDLIVKLEVHVRMI